MVIQDLQFLFQILQRELAHDRKGWQLVIDSWDAPSPYFAGWAFQAAAWQYRVDQINIHSNKVIAETNAKLPRPKILHIAPHQREAAFKRVGDRANDLIQELEKLDSTSLRWCVPPKEQEFFIKSLNSVARAAYEGEAAARAGKAPARGYRPGAGRDLLVEGLLLEIGTILISRGGSERLARLVAQIIDWWARGHLGVVDRAASWILCDEMRPGGDGSPLAWGGEAWKHVKPLIKSRLEHRDVTEVMRDTEGSR